jgi:hypothetical protein
MRGVARLAPGERSLWARSRVPEGQEARGAEPLDGACLLPRLAGIALLQDPTLVRGA